MAHSVPPELLAPEDREARAAELERRVGGEWFRFAIIEAATILLPYGLVCVLYATETVSRAVLVAGGVVAFFAMSALVLYWVFRRIQPLLNEIEALRSVQ